MNLQGRFAYHHHRTLGGERQLLAVSWRLSLWPSDWLCEQVWAELSSLKSPQAWLLMSPHKQQPETTQPSLRMDQQKFHVVCTISNYSININYSPLLSVIGPGRVTWQNIVSPRRGSQIARQNTG